MTTNDTAKLRKVCLVLANEVKIREDNLEATKKSIFGSDENTLEALQNDLNRINTIAATMLKLAEFAEYCLDQCSWDNEPDGGSIQDKAEELGFLKLRPIDPEDSIDGEIEHYFCKWTPAARKGDTGE